MAVSEVSICNEALGLIGQTQISGSLLGSTNESDRQCSLRYPSIRDSMLEDHMWNFAEKRSQLAALTETPDFEYDYYYQLPADCLKARMLYETEEPFRVEADDRIATNASSAKLLYTAQITDPTKFSPLFVSALKYRLAAELAMVMTTNRTLADTLYAKADAELSRAKMRDSQEGTARKRRRFNDWLSLRRSRGWGRD